MNSALRSSRRAGRAVIVAVIVVLVVLVIAHRVTNHSAPVASNSGAGASRCFTASQAWNEIGQSGCIEFNVGYTYVSSAGNAYLDQYANYSTGIEVWIPAGYSFGAGDTTKYANQTIRVTGVITSYEGAPQIEVTSPSQISLAS